MFLLIYIHMWLHFEISKFEMSKIETQKGHNTKCSNSKYRNSKCQNLNIKLQRGTYVKPLCMGKDL